jgi:hypothetical protein
MSLVVILAGYKRTNGSNSMNRIPGLSSHYPANHIDLDYTVEELLKVSKLMLERATISINTSC